jgi:large subunit ribosomal protein L10
VPRDDVARDPLDLQLERVIAFGRTKEHTMEPAEKVQVLGEIKEAFASVVSVVIADYRGLRVPTVTTMRDDFRKAGCHYRVLKNSLVKIAIKGSRMEPLSQLMVGTTAVIWSTDAPQPPAQVALKWARDEPKFKIRGGYYEGQLLDLAGIDALARMPGKAEIRASMLMTFLAAPQSFVAQLVAAPQNFAYLLDARRRRLEGGE